MSASLTYQPRREMMDIGQDTNGDGIPDGAEVTIKRTATDPVAGHTTVTSARFTKKAPQERRPMEPTPEAPAAGLPAAPAPVPADKQIPRGTPQQSGGNAWDQFGRRTDRAYDAMIGGTRTNTDVNPVSDSDRRQFLTRRSDDLSLAPAHRAAAGRRLAMMDENAGRAADLASSERRALYSAHGDQAKADAMLQGKVVQADAQRDVASTKGMSAQAVAEAKTKRDIVVQELKNSGQITVANTYAMAGRDKAELAAETDRVVAQLNKEGKVEAAQSLAAAKGKIDPTIWMTASEEERKQLLEMAKSKPAATIDSNPAKTESESDTVSKESQALDALKWARANPTDPRSAGILKKLGVK